MRSIFILVALSVTTVATAQSVSTSGSCPGVVTVDVSGVTPRGNFVILKGNGPGAAVVPGGPCAGTVSGLDRISWFGPFGTDAGGNAVLNPSVGAPAAGIIQVMDVATCAVSSTTETCSPAVELVGSYLVSDGPGWAENPPTYSCVEGCAEVFGGAARDYSCSTTADSVDNQGYVDGWGDSAFCTDPVHENYKLGDFYDCGAVGCSYSAYVTDHGCASVNYCFSGDGAPPAACDDRTEVADGGRCYYLDGSGGSCDPGYTLAPQSALTTISTDFIGKDYKNVVSDNCCVWHRDQDLEMQDWGMSSDCNAPGPFTAGPELGGAGCTDAMNMNPGQLTLCMSM